MRNACLTILLFSGLCSAQFQPPATSDELQYLRFVLLNVASLDHDPKAVQSFEEMLVKQFGLNNQESAAIHAAGQTLKPLLNQHRQSSRAILAGKTRLTPTDLAALANLDTQREQTITNLATQVLNSVRGETAGRLRAPGRIVATAVRGPDKEKSGK